MTDQRRYGAQTMTGDLRRVVVRRPDAAFSVDDPARWNYTSTPDLSGAQREHDALVQLLVDDGVEVIAHDRGLPDHADAIFVHDPVLVADTGTIVLRMGKELRRGEEAPLAATLQGAGVPVAGSLEGPAMAEGGDLLWLDASTLAAGQGFRTNAAAIEQLRGLLPGVEVVPVPLPYFGGPAACLHLMSLISIVAHDVAVVHRPLLPVGFLQLLAERGFRFVDVPADELTTHGSNVLATAPGRCIMLQGNPVTAGGLAAVGCDVRTYRGDEITLKAEGGATCLTRPVWRT